MREEKGRGEERREGERESLANRYIDIYVEVLENWPVFNT